MKIFMHWDMEGTSGLFTREQVWYWEPGVRPEAAEEGKQLLIADINSAVAAALEAGADEVIVCDTHHGGGNTRIEAMLPDRRVTYHVKPRLITNGLARWMPGLDESVDGLMLMGHHAKSGTPNSFLPHTWMSEWTDFRINGRSVGEVGIEACYGAHFGVPLVCVQGDRAFRLEMEEQFPHAVAVEVKEAVSHDLCRGPSAEEGRRRTSEGIAEAIARLRHKRPPVFKPELPMTVHIETRTVEGAEALAQKPTVKRTGDREVAYLVERHCDIVRHVAKAGLDLPVEAK